MNFRSFTYYVLGLYVVLAVPVDILPGLPGLVDQLAASIEQLSLEEGSKNFQLLKLRWMEAAEAERSKMISASLATEKSKPLSLDQSSTRMVAHLPAYQKQWIKSKPLALMTRAELDWLLDHDGGRVVTSRNPSKIESWIMEFWGLPFIDAIKINSAEKFQEFAVGFFRNKKELSDLQKLFLLHYFSADASTTGKLIFEDLVIQDAFAKMRKGSNLEAETTDVPVVIAHH